MLAGSPTVVEPRTAATAAIAFTGFLDGAAPETNRIDPRYLSFWCVMFANVCHRKIGKYCIISIVSESEWGWG